MTPERREDIYKEALAGGLLYGGTHMSGLLKGDTLLGTPKRGLSAGLSWRTHVKGTFLNQTPVKGQNLGGHL